MSQPRLPRYRRTEGWWLTGRGTEIPGSGRHESECWEIMLPGLGLWLHTHKQEGILIRRVLELHLHGMYGNLVYSMKTSCIINTLSKPVTVHPDCRLILPAFTSPNALKEPIQLWRWNIQDFCQCKHSLLLELWVKTRRPIANWIQDHRVPSEYGP